MVLIFFDFLVFLTFFFWLFSFLTFFFWLFSLLVFFFDFFWNFFFWDFFLFQNRVELFKISVTVLNLVRKMEKYGTNFFSERTDFLILFLTVVVGPGIRDHLWPPSFTANIDVSKVILKKPKKMAKKHLRYTFARTSAQIQQKWKVPPCREKKAHWNTVEF